MQAGKKRKEKKLQGEVRGMPEDGTSSISEGGMSGIPQDGVIVFSLGGACSSQKKKKKKRQLGYWGMFPHVSPQCLPLQTLFRQFQPILPSLCWSPR